MAREEKTMIKARVSSRDFLKELSAALKMTMEDTLDVAFQELAKDRAAWLINKKAAK